MPVPLTDHSQFIERHGLARWVLRECVRANPFYVISAAFLAYGCLLLNSDIEPRVGELKTIVLSLALLHVYEFAVLAAATVVLTRRNAAGGGDLHGLALVAALFLGGSFLALDELIALIPRLGAVLVPAALLLAWGKLAWYARLPGIVLPPRYRTVALAVLGGPALSPLLGHPDLARELGAGALQSVAWLCGWLSLLSVVHLVWLERGAIAAWRGVCDAPAPAGAVDEPDLLQTRWCGLFTILVCTAAGLLHLCASDWVFERPHTPLLWMPAATVMLAAFMLRRWFMGHARSAAALVAFGAPALALQWMWWNEPGVWQRAWQPALLLGPVLQMLAACAVVYFALARATGRREFYAGLSSPVAAFAESLFMQGRFAVPYFKALACAAAGFVTLAGATAISIYRERLLKWLDPPGVNAPPLSVPQDTLP